VSNAVNIAFHLHPAQRKAWTQRTKRNTVRCGRKWGKSTLARYIVMQGVAQGHRGAYIAPEYGYLTDWWSQLSEMYRGIITTDNHQEKFIQFANGAQLDFYSLDNLNTIRPHEYDYVILDECALSRYLQEAWEQAVRPTLTRRSGTAWFMSTPKPNLGGPYFKSLCDRTGAWSHTEGPSHGNPFLPIEDIEEARRELPDAAFRQEYLAEFVETDGVLVRASMIKIGITPQNIELHMGIDLASRLKTHNDFSSIAIVGRDKESGIVYIRDVWHGREEMHALLARVSVMAEMYDVARVYVEDVGYQDVFRQELQRTTALAVTGFNPSKMKAITKSIPKMSSDKVRRFMPLLARYEQGQVIHDERMSTVYADELMRFPSEHPDDHDDTIDAVVYAWASAVKPKLTGVVY